MSNAERAAQRRKEEQNLRYALAKPWGHVKDSRGGWWSLDRFPKPVELANGETLRMQVYTEGGRDRHGYQLPPVHRLAVGDRRSPVYDCAQLCLRDFKLIASALGR